MKGTFAERVLGARDEFGGLEVGFKKNVLRNEGESVVHIGGPTEIDLELPAKNPNVFPNFASTLLETPAIGSVSADKQRDKSNEYFKACRLGRRNQR